MTTNVRHHNCFAFVKPISLLNDINDGRQILVEWLISHHSNGELMIRDE